MDPANKSSYSAAASEVETNSVEQLQSENASPSVETALPESAAEMRNSLKQHAGEIAGMRDFTSQMIYRQLHGQFNSANPLSQPANSQMPQGTFAYTTPNAPPTLTPPATGNAGTVAVDALGMAAASGDLKKVQDLLKAGVDINARDSVNGWTPLMQAAMAGKNDIVKFLINNHADLDLQDQQKQTALFMAAKTGNTEAVALLRQNKANPNLHADFGRTPLMEAARLGDEKSVRVLTAGRPKDAADINATDANDRTALMEAAWTGNAKTVKALLDQFPNYMAKDNQGRTALMEASVKGKADSVKLLVDKINELDVPDVRSQLVNEKDDQGRTALMDASRSGNKDAVQELLRCKETQVDIKDQKGRTALIDAGEKGNGDSVKSLLNAGANVNAQDGEKRTALMEAAKNGNSAAVAALLTAKKPKPDLDLQDSQKNTALSEAVARQDVQSVKALVAAGARLDLQDINGKTALDIAKDMAKTAIADDSQKNSSEILKALENAPKKP